MLSDVAKKWVAALRSGEYKQCKNRLQHGGRYCCLGVGALVSGIPRKEWENFCALPPSVVTALGLRDGEGIIDGGRGVSLAVFNDHQELTFAEIADVIESEPKGLFIT